MPCVDGLLLKKLSENAEKKKTKKKTKNCISNSYN